MRFIVLVIVVAACGGSSSKQQPDAAQMIDGAICVPETDAELCTRVNGCEQVAVNDNCGTTRMVDCGGCSGSNACVASQCRAAQCAALTFPNQTLAATMNADNVQDAMGAVSSDGLSVINQRRTCFGAFSTLLIDTQGGNTVTVNLSTQGSFTATRHDQEATFGMSGDALTVVGVTTAGTGFLTSTRPAKGSSAFPVAAPGVFANIAVASPAFVISPALSQDGLRFYYSVRGSTVTADNGIYESVRTSTAATFPAATKMGGDVQAFDSVTAISADGMSLFVQTAFEMHVLSRRSVKQPFTNPNTPNASPIVPGFRTRPIGDCSQLLGTCTGGCNNEQTCVFTH